jgi:hypothetical protein
VVARASFTCGLVLALAALRHDVQAQRPARPPARALAARSHAPQSAAVGATAPPSIAHVEYGVRIEPDTVTVGLPFRVVVRVRAPQGARVTFPTGPDSGGTVEALDPRTVAALGDSLATDVTATYRLAAWDVGRLPLAFGGVVVQDHDASRTISLGGLSIVVAPTVPSGGKTRVVKPARPLYPDRAAWWWPGAIAAAALAALGIGWLLVRWWRRRARRVVAPVGALGVAERELADIDHLGLVEAGESGRYVALIAEVVRSYLARRIPGAPLSSTTGELLAALESDTRIPIDRVRALLTETDFIKFADQHIGSERVRAAVGTARTLVADIDAAIAAADVAAHDAAARQTAREFEQRRAARATGSRGQAA